MKRWGLSSFEELQTFREFSSTKEGKKQIAEWEKLKDRDGEPYQLSFNEVQMLREWMQDKDVEEGTYAEWKAYEAEYAKKVKDANTKAKRKDTEAFKRARAKYEEEVSKERGELLDMLDESTNKAALTNDDLDEVEERLDALNKMRNDYVTKWEDKMPKDDRDRELTMLADNYRSDQELLEAARSRAEFAAREARRVARAAEDEERMEKLYRMRHQLGVEMALRVAALKAGLEAPGGLKDEQGEKVPAPKWVQEMLDRLKTLAARPYTDDPEGKESSPFASGTYAEREAGDEYTKYADDAAAGGGDLDGDDDDDDDAAACAKRGIADMLPETGDPDEVLMTKDGSKPFTVDDTNGEEADAMEGESTRPLHMQFKFENIPRSSCLPAKTTTTQTTSCGRRSRCWPP